MQIENDIIYDADNRLTTDVYYPTANETRGVVIMIHGGGWLRGDKSKEVDLGKLWASQGYLTFVPNYRLAPAAYYPAPLEDMDTLYHWIKNSNYQFDQTHIAVCGSSVGGNMAVEMAIKYGIPAISWSGVLDIDEWITNHQQLTGKLERTISQHSGQDDNFYKGFIMNYFNNQVDKLVAATPYHRVNGETGPMFLANSLDEFIPNTGVLKISNALAENKVVHTVRFVAGNRHAKNYVDEIFDESALFLSKWF